MKIRTLLFASLLLGMTLSSCEKNQPAEPLQTTGAWVLNNGSFSMNNSSLGLYNPVTKEYTADVFSSLNGKDLGDTGQDIIAYGSKLYISVYASKVVYVTDKSGKLIKEIKHEENGAALSPRYFEKYNGKVYVSYYEGYLGQIDTAGFDVKTVKVGDNPENVVELQGRLYVANSGGMSTAMGTTLSVVDPAKMTVDKEITVNTNPVLLEKNSNGMLYIASNGNFYDIPGKLQQYDYRTGKVTDIEGIAPAAMAMTPSDKLCIIETKYDANWTPVSTLISFDTKSGKSEGSFVTDGTAVEKPFSVSVDPVSGNIYVGTSDYVTDGGILVFDAAGKKMDSFGSQGINPIKVCFTTNR